MQWTLNCSEARLSVPTTPEEIVRTHIVQNILFSKKYPHPDDASFLEEGIIDSMNVMELIMFVEEKFGLEVADEEIVPDNFDSVSKIAAYVRRKTLQPA
jgi:acyl carrier protein